MTQLSELEADTLEEEEGEEEEEDLEEELDEDDDEQEGVEEAEEEEDEQEEEALKLVENAHGERISGCRSDSGQYPYHFHPRAHLMQQQQYPYLQKASVQHTKLNFHQRRMENDDDAVIEEEEQEEEDEDEDGGGAEEDEVGDDSDEEDEVAEDDFDADVKEEGKDRVRGENGVLEGDEDLVSTEKPEQLKEYDLQGALASEELLMEKNEGVETHNGADGSGDDGHESTIAEVGAEGQGHASQADPEPEDDILDFMERSPELDDGTPEEQAEFVKELNNFFSDRKMEYKPPKFYGKNLNCLKLWRTVIRLGGYDKVTAFKLWRQVGDRFKPPSSCTTVSWSFREFYKKALLDYEKFKLEGILPNSGQCDGQCEGGAPNANTSQANYVPSSGRARRDAASRAMQSWHAQPYFSNETGSLVAKERSLNSASKRAKQMGLLKRKRASGFERDVQTARIKKMRAPFVSSKVKDDNWEQVGNQSFLNLQRNKPVKQEHRWKAWGSSSSGDAWVNDEGPQADWVKINVHKTHDCFEVYALVPGLTREEAAVEHPRRQQNTQHFDAKIKNEQCLQEYKVTEEAVASNFTEVRVQCEPSGQLGIIGDPEQPNNPWGVTPFKKVINLASSIDVSQTSAVLTLHGQLFIRVPFSEEHA